MTRSSRLLILAVKTKPKTNLSRFYSSPTGSGGRESVTFNKHLPSSLPITLSTFVLYYREGKKITVSESVEWSEMRVSPGALGVGTNAQRGW